MVFFFEWILVVLYLGVVNFCFERFFFRIFRSVIFFFFRVRKVLINYFLCFLNVEWIIYYVIEFIFVWICVFCVKYWNFCFRRCVYLRDGWFRFFDYGVDVDLWYRYEYGLFDWCLKYVGWFYRCCVCFFCL